MSSYKNKNKSIKIVFNGKDYEIPKQHFSLLSELSQLKLPLNSGCRMGICGACKVQKLKGDIAYKTSPLYALKDQEILTCISQATSDLELEL